MQSFRAPLVSLAPMAGVTDIPFRRQVKAFAGRYCVSEMIASDQLARERIDMVRRASPFPRPPHAPCELDVPVVFAQSRP